MGKYQESDKNKLLQNGDKVIATVPGLEHPITINEIHAFQMGLIGFVFGAFYSSGMEMVAGSTALLLVTYAILGNPAFGSLGHDDPKYKSIGMKTIKHEPWYFIVPFVTTFVLGIVFLTPYLN